MLGKLSEEADLAPVETGRHLPPEMLAEAELLPAVFAVNVV